MFKGIRTDSLLIYTVLFSSIIILADLTGYITSIKRFRAFTTYPLVVATSTIKKSTSNFLSIFRQESLLKENNQLKQRNLELESKLSDLEQSKTVAAEIAKYTSTITAKEYKKTVTALIIDNSYSNNQGQLLLAKGTSSNIEKGMPVVLGSTYIGYISEASDFSSVCTTYLQPGQQFVGYLLTRKITASVKTTLSAIQLFDLLATDTVQLLDTVSIKREKYPYFFTLATIIQLPNKTGSAERTAVLESPIRISELTYVTVVQE
jgi:cell shape-determining protein MreC